MPKKIDLIEKHTQSIQDFNKAQTAQCEERELCLEDRRFVSIAGAQWEGDLKEYYAKRTRIEVNKIQMQSKRIKNDFRKNKVTVNFKSKTGKDDELADLLDGLYRADELDSNADEAYNNAFGEGVDGGFGAYRFRAIYEDELDDENEFQRIVIEPITDADSCVFFNNEAKRQDKRDATKCWVLTSTTHDAFKEEWDRDATSVEKQVDQSEFDWSTKEHIYVAEYYEVEFVPHTVRKYVNEAIDEEERIIVEDYEEDELFAKEEELKATGFKLVKEKKIEKKKIHKYIMSGSEILEDCGYMSGTEIPVVPFYGERWFVDGIERMAGVARFAKDAQRLKNIQMSSLAEIASKFTTEKPIFTTEQIAGDPQRQWENDYKENFPFLTVNAIEDANGNEQPLGPLAYTKPPSIPPAIAALMAQSDADIQELLSSNIQMDSLNANMSGEAISKLIDNQDVQNSIYQANFVIAMKRGGEIYMSMARDIYVEEDREIKTLDKEGSSSRVMLNKMGLDDESIAILKNDLTKANFDVVADVGASTSSKREATVKTLINALQMTTDTETKMILESSLVMNMEGEGISDFRPFFRKKLVRIGALEATEEELQEMQEEAQNQEPTAIEKALEAEATKAEADAKQSNADTIKTVAEVEKTQAQTAEIMAGIDREDRGQALDTVEKITNH